MNFLPNHNCIVCVEERILLHLLNYRDSTDEYDVPFELTSTGIAKVVGTNRSYISSTIKNSVIKGYVEKYTGHIKNGKKIQGYFLLKDKGRNYSIKLKKMLSNLSIILLFPDNTTKVMKFNKIIPYLKKEKICSDIDELTLYKLISKNGIIKIELIKKLTKIQFINQSEEAPSVQNFLGREKEMGLLKKWMEDEKGRNFIFIYGMPGIGKSTLAAKLIESYRESKHIFWHNFHNLDSIRGVLFKLTKFLSKLEQCDLEKYIRTHNNLDYYQISLIITKTISLINAVLIFDNFHESSDEIKRLFCVIFRKFPIQSKTKIIILSREIVYLGDINNIRPKELIVNLELQGIDFNSGQNILKEKNYNKNKFKKIFEYCAGNPKLLEIRVPADHEKYIHYELFSKLDEDEKKILGMISTFRIPIQEDALFIYDDFDLKKLFNLKQCFIVKKDVQNRYFLDDIFKHFFYNRLSQSNKKNYHLLAAQWYEKKNEPITLIESIYHYSTGGNYKKSSMLAIDASKSIFSNGYITEFLEVLEGIDEKNVNPAIRIKMQELKKEARFIHDEQKKLNSYITQNSEKRFFSMSK